MKFILFHFNQLINHYNYYKIDFNQNTIFFFTKHTVHKMNNKYQ